MGRAKVNDLLDFFVAKYGGEDTVEFQKAHLNFSQSMAAYSVACYILQTKDRHNGNTMIPWRRHFQDWAHGHETSSCDYPARSSTSSSPPRSKICH